MVLESRRIPGYIQAQKTPGQKRRVQAGELLTQVYAGIENPEHDPT